MIAYHNHGQEPAEMPDFYRLTGEMVLVLNNKKDAYYVVTPTTCSCPAATYHAGPCKHQRKYFAPPKKEVATEEPTEGAKRLARLPEDSIKPAAKWPGGRNGPVDEIMGVA